MTHPGTDLDAAGELKSVEQHQADILGAIEPIQSLDLQLLDARALQQPATTGGGQ